MTPSIYQALAIAIGLETWARHRIKVNRAYSPAAMMHTAAMITGKGFSPRDYLGAARALRSHIEKLREAETLDAARARVMGEK